MRNKSKRVFLVEDNPADANLVEEALEEAGVDCDLQLLRDGVQAIERIERIDADPSQPAPDLVLLDLNLPKVGGEEVLKRLRSSRRCKSAKVLIISSSDVPADKERLLKLGASEYFRKPSALAQFMALGPKVRRILENARPSESM